MGGTALVIKQVEDYSSDSSGSSIDENKKNYPKDYGGGGAYIDKYYRELPVSSLLGAEKELQLAQKIEKLRDEFLYLPFREAKTYQTAYSIIYR